MFTVYFFQSYQVGVIVSPFSFDGAKNVLINFLPLSVQLWVGLVALVVLFYGVGILASINLSSAFSTGALAFLLDTFCKLVCGIFGTYNRFLRCDLFSCAIVQ